MNDAVPDMLYGNMAISPKLTGYWHHKYEYFTYLASRFHRLEMILSQPHASPAARNCVELQYLSNLQYLALGIITDRQRLVSLSPLVWHFRAFCHMVDSKSRIHAGCHLLQYSTLCIFINHNSRPHQQLYTSLLLECIDQAIGACIMTVNLSALI